MSCISLLPAGAKNSCKVPHLLLQQTDTANQAEWGRFSLLALPRQGESQQCRLIGRPLILGSSRLGILLAVLARLQHREAPCSNALRHLPSLLLHCPTPTVSLSKRQCSRLLPCHSRMALGTAMAKHHACHSKELPGTGTFLQWQVQQAKCWLSCSRTAATASLCLIWRPQVLSSALALLAAALQTEPLASFEQG